MPISLGLVSDCRRASVFTFLKLFVSSGVAIIVGVAAVAASPQEPTTAAEQAARQAAIAAQTKADYLALVATLPPAEQAWELVLQENLGGFYLPIHMRQRVAGQSKMPGTLSVTILPCHGCC